MAVGLVKVYPVQNYNLPTWKIVPLLTLLVQVVNSALRKCRSLVVAVVGLFPVT